jgi:hypothetical protein
LIKSIRQAIATMAEVKNDFVGNYKIKKMTTICTSDNHKEEHTSQIELNLTFTKDGVVQLTSIEGQHCIGAGTEIRPPTLKMDYDYGLVYENNRPTVILKKDGTAIVDSSIWKEIEKHDNIATLDLNWTKSKQNVQIIVKMEKIRIEKKDNKYYESYNVVCKYTQLYYFPVTSIRVSYKYTDPLSLFSSMDNIYAKRVDLSGMLMINNKYILIDVSNHTYKTYKTREEADKAEKIRRESRLKHIIKMLPKLKEDYETSKVIYEKAIKINKKAQKNYGKVNGHICWMRKSSINNRNETIMKIKKARDIIRKKCQDEKKITAEEIKALHKAHIDLKHAKRAAWREKCILKKCEIAGKPLKEIYNTAQKNLEETKKTYETNNKSLVFAYAEKYSLETTKQIYYSQ